MFYFSAYHPSSLKDFSYLSGNFWMPDAKNCCPRHWKTTDCTSVCDTNFCPPSIFTPNVNCSLCKALVAIYWMAWMHFRVNLIWIYIFCPQNTITTCCSLREDFRVNIAVFNAYKWRQWRHRHETHSYYSELNSLQNVYFKFLIFGKLTKWCCFVTYLLNDTRIRGPIKLQIFS